MTAITVTPAVKQPVAARWIALAAVAFLTIALAAWLVSRVAASNTDSVTPGYQAPVKTVQQNQLCAPAPGTRYC